MGVHPIDTSSLLEPESSANELLVFKGGSLGSGIVSSFRMPNAFSWPSLSFLNMDGKGAAIDEDVNRYLTQRRRRREERSYR